jgi:hypothetical protein
MCTGQFHAQAIDSRARGGDNAFRFVDMAIGELRSVDEALDHGAERARDRPKAGRRSPAQQRADWSDGFGGIGRWGAARHQAMITAFEFRPAQCSTDMYSMVGVLVGALARVGSGQWTGQSVHV